MTDDEIDYKYLEYEPNRSGYCDYRKDAFGSWSTYESTERNDEGIFTDVRMEICYQGWIWARAQATVKKAGEHLHPRDTRIGINDKIAPELLKKRISDW